VILTGMSWLWSVILICISLMTNKSKYFP
jgi:hypothetical protein